MRRILIRVLCGVSVSGILAALFAGCGFSAGLSSTEDALPNSYTCGCECAKDLLSLSPDPRPAQGSDDAEEILSGGAMSVNGTNLEMVDAPAVGLQRVGIRFPQVNVPKGALIESAFIQFTTSQATNVTTELFFRAEASDHALPFTNAAQNLSSRPNTGAVEHWTVPAWNTVGEAGANQRTPNLKTLLQDIVNRPAWGAGHAMVVLVDGTGLRSAVTFEQNPAQAARLIVTYRDPPVRFPLQVCVPAALNPNLDGGVAPTVAQQQADCSGRVQNTIHGLTLACSYPSFCTCTSSGTPRFSAECNDPCVEDPLLFGCSNFNPETGVVTATNAPGGVPVCTTASPVSAAMFGKRSTCEITDAGTATVEVPDEDTKHPKVTGVVEFSGDPCPGGPCAVSMTSRLDMTPITYSHTFGSKTFVDLAALSKTNAGFAANLSPAGTGLFGPGATAISARGREGSDSQAFVASNTDAISVSINWTPGAASCGLSGSLIGSADPERKRCENAGPFANEICLEDVDCGEAPECSDGICNCIPLADVDMTLSMSLSGPITNQPPHANAGPDQTVECNQVGGAQFTLDGTGSTDPDNNIASYVWFSGSRAGPVLADQASVVVTQANATSVAYVLRAIDGNAQADEDTAGAQVVDTTLPVISCNHETTLSPPETPISYSATATDVCDGHVPAVITEFECFKFSGSGKRIDTSKACGVSFVNGTINIPHSGGIGDHITWTVTATDSSGNTASRKCKLEIVKYPQRKPLITVPSSNLSISIWP